MPVRGIYFYKTHTHTHTHANIINKGNGTNKQKHIHIHLYTIQPALRFIGHTRVNTAYARGKHSAHNKLLPNTRTAWTKRCRLLLLWLKLVLEIV